MPSLSVWQAFFALRLRICLEQFKQLYVAHVLNHFLGRRTERVVGFVVVDLVEEIVNEDDFRSSSRVREHRKFSACFHNCMWQSQTLWSQEWNILPGFTSLQLVLEVRQFMNKWATPTPIPRTNYLHVRCSMTSYGELQTTKRNVLLTPPLVSSFAKRFPAGRWSFLGLVISSDLGQTLTKKDTEENGDKVRWIDDDQIRRRRTSCIPEPRVPLSRGTLKMPRRWEIIDTLLCQWWYESNCFFAQLFLIISSVFAEQSQICVREYKSCPC